MKSEGMEANPDIVTVTDENFDKLAGDNKNLVIDCWAPWCGPCRMIAPLVDELAVTYKGKVTFGKLNVDENMNLPRQFAIMGIPVLLFLKDGELVDKIVGAVPKSHIVDKITETYGV
jgi:thioredoxin 1